MKRMIIRIAVASLTFIIGVSVAMLYLIKHNSVEAPLILEQPVYQPVRDVEYSELATKPEKYVGQMVRVKALIFGGPLANPRLVNEDVSSFWMGYDFAPDAAEASVKLEEAFGPDVYIPHKVVRCERALATVTGEFIEDDGRTKENKKVGNRLGYRCWIIIHRLENIEACPKLWFHDVHAALPNESSKRTVR